MRQHKPLLLALLLGLGLASQAEAAITIAQQSACAAQGPGNDTQAFSGNTTSGNTIVVTVEHYNGTSGTYGVSDATNGAYTSTASNAGIVHIAHFRNSTFVGTTISITAPASDSTYGVCMYELAGASNSLNIEICTGSDPGGTTNHNTCDSGISGIGFGVAVNHYGGNGGTTTAGSGWTKDATEAAGVVQHQIATFSANTGAFTTSLGTSSTGAMAIFPDTTGEGGGGGGPGTQDRLPTGTGYAMSWSPSGAATSWEAVDDPVGTPDDDTTYMIQQNSNSVGMFTFAAFSITSTAITNLTIHLRCKNGAGDANGVAAAIRINGVDYNLAGNSLTTSYQDFAEVWATNPATMAAWTEAEIEGIGTNGLDEFGAFPFSNGGPGEEVRCTSVYATVNYTAPAGGGGGHRARMLRGIGD